MSSFRPLIEDFTATIDALRDFVDSVGPVLLERQENALKSEAEVMAPFHAAALLATEDISAVDLPTEMKKTLVAAREILTGSSQNTPPEKAIEFGDSIRKKVPIKIVNGKVEIDLDQPAALRIMVHRRATEQLRNEVRLLRESSLMVLTTRSEWFVAQLVHLFFKRWPDAAGTSEPFFSLNTLASLQTIDEARDVLIEHKVESLMRLSFDDWIKFFRQKPKLGMGYLGNDTHRIGEIFRRRNLIVHNGGRVSRRYIQEVDEPLRMGLKLGDTIDVTPEYLHGSADLIEHLFVLIAAELWKKLDPEDDARGQLLQNLSVQRIREHRWAMARGFAYFVMNDNRLPEFTQLAARVNYWQTFKWAGQYDQIRAEVDACDFSAKNPLFQFALATIKDDFESVFRLLPAVLENRHLSRYELLDWPLFQAVRERPEFVTYMPQTDSGNNRSEASAEACDTSHGGSPTEASTN